MPKFYSRMFKIILIAILFYAVERFCHKQTSGFSLSKIIPRHQLCGKGLEGLQLSEVESILSQPFYFLGRGGQCYVFESEDKTVVIKFFKQHHMQFLNWLENIKLFGPLDAFRNKILHKHHHQSESFFFQSCQLAYEKLKEHTGMIYLHLNRTDCFKQKLLIVDKLGIKHHLDPNEINFALQKKAVLSHRKFRKLIRESNIETAKRCIDSILDLITERCKQGIKDRDPNFRTNIGFLGEEAIEIDIGSYQYDEQLSFDYGKEVIDQTQKFRKWLERRNKELANYLKEKLENTEVLWPN